MAPVQPVLTREEWEHLKVKQRMEQIVPRSGWDLQGLVFKPRNIHFATQNPTEDIFILLRRHWITNVRWLINLAVFTATPIVLAAVAGFFGFNVVDAVGFKLVSIFSLIWLSLALSYAYNRITEWYFNVYIVTDERVLDITYIPFQSREVVETNLGSVENVQETSIGFLPGLFNYGDVRVFTAAEQNIILFEDIPNPTLVRDRVSDLAKLIRDQENQN